MSLIRVLGFWKWRNKSIALLRLHPNKSSHFLQQMKQQQQQQQQQEGKIKNKLKIFKFDLLANVYSETSKQLRIFQNGKHLNNKQISIYRKRSVQDSNDKNDKSDKRTQLSKKLLNDINMDKVLDNLQEIYKIGSKELRKDNKDTLETTRLVEAIESFKYNNKNLEEIMETFQLNKRNIETIKQQIIKEQEEGKKKLEENGEKIRNLRHELLSIELLHNMEMKLLAKWDTNRETQVQIVSEKQQKSLIQQLLDVKKKMEQEERLIGEIGNCYENQIFTLNEQLSQWEQKYKKEMENILLEIQEIMNQITELQENHENYRELCKEHIAFVEDYLKCKEEEQRLHEEQCYRIRCAVRLQAWWRGVMFTTAGSSSTSIDVSDKRNFEFKDMEQNLDFLREGVVAKESTIVMQISSSSTFSKQNFIICQPESQTDQELRDKR
uniref:Dynein regulatory complex protein 9 n=1 Tax=Glossina austeni TaxID=7395 RepID=A0A1A9V8J6_GLOAU